MYNLRISQTMDKITQSLQCYLNRAKIKFNTLYNLDKATRFEKQTSTIFHITRKIDGRKMAIVTDIYPQQNKLFFSTHPFLAFDGEERKEITIFANKWNSIGMFSTIVLDEEKGVIQPETYCFNLISQTLTENNGLSFKLWRRYFDLIIEESLEAWGMIHKILNLPFKEPLELIESRKNEDSLKEYIFN